MLITLPNISILLVLLHIVNSANLQKNKQIPRRHTELTRSFNHPPVVENYDFIPVTVIYEEDIESPRRRSLKKVGIFKEETKEDKLLTKVVGPETRSVNHPPSATYSSFMEASDSDFEMEILLKPKKNFDNLESPPRLSAKKETGKFPRMERILAEKEINTGNEEQRRRSQQVRKVKVNKNQLQEYINETKSSINQTEKAVDSKDQSSRQLNEKQTNITKYQNFSKRGKDSRPTIVPILESESYVFAHSGDFHYSYESGDGTKASERGELKNSNGGTGSAVEGSFSYKGKDGADYSLTYTADENGYRPVGAHLPTSPPIPPAIQRALDFLATKTTPAPVTEKINLSVNVNLKTILTTQ